MAVLLAAGAFPATAAADEPLEAQLLPGTTVAALGIDIDGDGTREVLRLVPAAVGDVELEAWRFDENKWTELAAMTLELPQLGGSVAPWQGIASLLRWRLDGRDEAVLVTGSMEGAPNAQPTVCCVQLARLRLGRTGFEMTSLASGMRAELIQAVDFDADGTDELVSQLTTYPTEDGSGRFEFEIQRWTGTGFAPIFAGDRDEPSGGLIAGDADGLPGDEVYLTDATSGESQRLAMVDGAIEPSAERLLIGDLDDSWITAVANDRIILGHSTGFESVRWNHDRAPVRIAEATTPGYPFVSVLGGGDDGLVLVYDGFFGSTEDPTIAVYDMDLQPLGELSAVGAGSTAWREITDITTSASSISHNVVPYTGPFPGRLAGDGWTAFVANGTYVEGDGAGSFSVSSTSLMLGSYPVGVAGPRDEWVMLGDGSFGFERNGSAVYLYPNATAGGSAGRLVLATIDEALRRDPVGEASVEHRGAVEVVLDGRPTIIAPPDGFEAIVTAAPGSLALVRDGVRVEELEIGNSPGIIQIAPPARRGDPEDRDFERIIIVISADGHASVARLEGVFLAEPPQLTAHAETDAFALHSTMFGRSSEPSLVTVDGRAAPLNENGVFRVEVDAPIWPRDVVIVARDPLGNETTQRIQIVGFLDYRGLPWAPMLGLVTVGAGLLLFVRTPRRRPARGPAWDDGLLEEIDGDLR